MADNDYLINLKAALDKENSQKQINQDIKTIEKSINQLHLVASLYKGDSRKQINSVIAQLESKVKVIKLRAKLDNKQAQNEINRILKNVALKDISINEQGIKLKALKIYSILDSVVSKFTISPAIEFKKENLQKSLSEYLNKNSKINEASVYSSQADELKELFVSVDSKESLEEATKKLQLFKAEVEAAGYATAAAASKISNLSKAFTSLSNKLETAESWEGRLNSLQNTWNNFINSITNRDYENNNSSLLDNTMKSFEKLKNTIGAIPALLTEINNSSVTLNNDSGNIETLYSADNKTDLKNNNFELYTKPVMDIFSLVSTLNPELKPIEIIFQTVADGISSVSQYQENARKAKEEAVKESAEKIKSLNQELQLNQKTISESAERYAELAQGVDTLSGKNISLNTGDYEEFLSLSNQIASIFPNLSRVYDENGNAILQLSGNVDTIVGSLNNLIQAQNDLVNTKIAEELPTKFENVSENSKHYTTESENLKKKSDAFENIFGDNDFTNNFMNDVANHNLTISSDNLEVLYQMRDEYIKILEESNIEYKDSTPEYGFNDKLQTVPIEFGFIITATNDDIKKAQEILKEKTDSLKEKYTQTIANLKDDIENLNNKNKVNWSSLGYPISAWLSNEPSYKANSDLQAPIQQIIDNLDWPYLHYNSSTEAQTYIQDNILAKFDGTDGKKNSEALEKMFNLKTSFQNNEITLNEYLNKLKSFENFINSFDAEAKKSINTVLSTTSSNDLDIYTLKQNVENKLQTKSKDKVEKLTLTDLEIANKLQVPDDTVLSWEELIHSIEKYKRSLTSVQPLSKEDVITNINSLSGGFESLDKIRNSIENKNNPFDYTLLDGQFKDNFSNLGEAYTNFLDTITNSPKDINATQPAFSKLITTWLNSSGALNGLTDENAKLAISMLQNKGIANAEDIVMLKLADTHNQLAAQKYYDAHATELLSATSLSEISTFVDEGEAAGVSKQALAELALQKLSVNGATIDTASDIDQVINLANAAGASATVLAKLANAKAIISKAEAGKLNGSAGDFKQLEYAHQLLSDIENGTFDFQFHLDPAKFKKPVYNSGGSKSTNKTEKPAKEIDFIDRQLQLLEDKRTELINKASSTFIDYLGITQDEFNRAKELFNSDVSPMSAKLDELAGIAQKAGLSIGKLNTLISEDSPPSSKRNYLSQVLELDKSLLSDYEKAVQQYQSEYEKALEKVSPENRDKIENGASSIDTLSGEEAETVQNAITARDKLTSTIKKQSEMQEKYIQDSIAPYESKSEAIENQNKQLENSNSLLEKQIDYYKSAGEIVDSSLYENLIQNTGKQITNTNGLLENKRAELNEMLDKNVSKTSKEYVNLKSEISDTEAKIYALSKAQEEYNNQLLQLPIENLSTVISMYKDINSTIENWGAELEASGKKLDSDYYQSMISNGSIIIDQYKEQASVIEDVMDHYDVGSDNWNELYGKLQNVNSEMSSMVQNLYKWNEELLKMPMENISNYSSELEKVTDGLNNVKNEYDTVISTVTGALNDQIDAINKQKDAANEEYEASKKSLQDKLDLLNKQNEELKLQQTYEQALYNLQKVNQQATEQVIRDGQIVYEQDADNLREAQEAVQDARYDLETNKIQSQIDDLQETLDGLNDNYQEQIDSLQKISDKWSEISDKITQAQNEAKASEILGNDWKDKVLFGNDTEIFNNFSGMYTEISKQLKQYQEQIDTTNNIYSLLEDYIASYKDGTISYEQALSGINGLLAQMNQTMSANGNLQNIYDYLSNANGTSANADSLLNGIKQGLTTTANELLESMEQYKKNSGMISEYTSSWQQLTDNVSAMLDVLKEVRDNLEDAADDSEDDNSKHSSGEPYMGGSYVYGGPGDHIETRKTGIVKGLVGTSSASDCEARMKLIGLKKLDPDEIPAILHKNEAVFNTDQQDMILRNFAAAYRLGPYIPDYSKALSNISTRETAAAQEITFNGGITIQECNNTNELAQGILNGGLRSALIQESGKR